MDSLYHQFYLMQALSLAQQRQGLTAPNPAVGAVVVADGHVLASGSHFAAGHPHAEVMALLQVEQPGLDLYVTLEPCCHSGKTPPCTELIIAKGIRRVFFAYLDPNPQVAGQGQQRLLAAGIECHHVPMPEIDEFYRHYHYWFDSGLPFATFKIAIDRSGAIAAAGGQPAVITAAQAQQYTHQQRQAHSAILTSVTTVLADDPLLNVRLADREPLAKPVFVLDRQQRFPAAAKLWRSAAKLYLVHAHTELNDSYQHYAAQSACELLTVPQHEDCLQLQSVWQQIGAAGYHDVWIEAGGNLLSSCLQAGLVNRLLVYIGAEHLGKDAYRLANKVMPTQAKVKDLLWQQFGEDAVLQVDFH